MKRRFDLAVRNALHASAGRPLNEITQRYIELRVKQKLDHAGAMAQMATAGK